MNFDKFYSSKSTYFSPVHSGGMEACLKKYNVQACTAIDIGAGEGRNSLYLASLGFEVYAVEPSKVGAKKILQRAEGCGVEVAVLNTDIITATKNLNNIGFAVAMTSFEHMEYEYLLEAVREIKRVLKSGGYIYAMVFTEDDPGFKKDISNASECALYIKHYFKKGELKELFSDFEILEYSEYMKIDEAHGPVHYHGKAKLFARKLFSGAECK